MVEITKQQYLVALITSVFIALVGYMIAVFWSGSEETLRALSSLNRLTWLVIVSLSLANYLLRFFRWEVYLKQLCAFNLPRFRHLLIYVAGFALTTTPGKTGEALRSFYLKPYGVSFSNSLSVLFVERLVDLLAIVFMSLFALSYFDDEGIQIVSIASSIALIVVLPLVHNQSIWSLVSRTGKLLPGRLSALTEHLVTLIASSAILLKNKLLYTGFGLGLLAWSFEGVGFYLLLDALNVDCSVVLAIGIYSVAVLAGAVSFLPGGLGGTEAVMILLLISIGVDKPTAVAATLICRIVTLWLAVLLGVMAMFFLARHGTVPSYKIKV